MSANSFGRNYRFTIFGESHGAAIGVVIEGVPSGVVIDDNLIQAELNRRRPGQSKITTPRNEKDQFQILSGIHEHHTTGGPIALMIQNSDTRSKDYSLFRKIHRPSQVDYPALLRFGDSIDLRGSGMFSGRLTAPIVMAGAIAKMILAQEGIVLAGFVSQIGFIKDERDYSVEEILKNVESNIVRAVDSEIAQKMINLIDEIRQEEDSIGGIISMKIENFPKGIGDPWFHSLESDLAAGVLSIPATRGIEFGTGFAAASMKGSEHNDQYILNDGKISTSTNHCGGIVGGISIGTPITFRVPIKPTASIGKSQQTLNFETKEMVELKISGRHDPCIVPRALVGIEAITACILLDHLLSAKSYMKK